MRTTGGKYEGIKIAYIGGGSRNWAWTFMQDLAVQDRMTGQVWLYDIDERAALANVAVGTLMGSFEGARTKWDYKCARTLPEALDGADFVVISILPGSFEDMFSDVHQPEQYGVFQSVGDTAGAGGILRAMRTIPTYFAFGEAIGKHCPDAWVINLTNPMTLCVRALYEAFPGIKAYGCCHEVFGTQHLLCAALDEVCGIKGAGINDVRTGVVGLNHFTFINQANYGDIDLFDVYKEFIRLHPDGYDDEHDGGKGYFASANLVKFDLFDRFGAIAAAGDRHLAEFCPQGWYLGSEELRAKFKFHLTPVKWRIDNVHKRRRASEELRAGREKKVLRKTEEEGVRQMLCLLGDGEMVTNINQVNRGQMPDLPGGVVVETNALISRDSIRPVYAGYLPQGIASLVRLHSANHEALLYAAKNHDIEAAFRVFCADPQLFALSGQKCRALYDKMVQNTRGRLDWWFSA